KDAVQQLNDMTSQPVRLFVKREAYVAAPYANANIRVLDLRNTTEQVRSGDYVLVNTRLNDDHSTYRDALNVIEIKRGYATFCFVRQIPRPHTRNESRPVCRAKSSTAHPSPSGATSRWMTNHRRRSPGQRCIFNETMISI